MKSRTRPEALAWQGLCVALLFFAVFSKKHCRFQSATLAIPHCSAVSNEPAFNCRTQNGSMPAIQNNSLGSAFLSLSLGCLLFLLFLASAIQKSTPITEDPAALQGSCQSLRSVDVPVQILAHSSKLGLIGRGTSILRVSFLKPALISSHALPSA